MLTKWVICRKFWIPSLTVLHAKRYPTSRLTDTENNRVETVDLGARESNPVNSARGRARSVRPHPNEL